MRKTGVWILVFAVAALGATMPSMAQFPSTCQVELFGAEENPSTDHFDEGETRTFAFTVENTGELDADASVYISESPPGWSWPSSAPTIQSLSPGETQQRAIDITFTGDMEADAGFEMVLEDIECQTLGLTGGTISGDTNSPQTLTFTHAPLPVPSDGGLPWAWIVFGVIVAAAVVGVPVAYQQRGARVSASVEESEKDVIAGRGTSFPVTLKNQSNDPVPVRLEITDVQEGWSALTTLPDLELAAKETRTVYMMVRAPPDAKPGDLCVAKLTVKPEGGSPTTVKTLSRVDKTNDQTSEDPDDAQDEDD